MSTLIVYYSRSSVTKKVAEAIQSKLSCDIDEIIPKVNYQGRMGYARGIKDGMGEKIIDLESLKYDPGDYDLVYLGVPVWASKAANPMISYIKQNEGEFNNVKFFVTAGSSGFEKTFEQMEKYLGKAPLKTLSLTTKEVKTDNFEIKLDSFLE